MARVVAFVLNCSRARTAGLGIFAGLWILAGLALSVLAAYRVYWIQARLGDLVKEVRSSRNS